MKAVGNIRHFHFKTELSIEIEIISIAELYSGNRNILTLPHRCSFYHIIWVQKGRAMHHVDFTPVFLEPDSVLFVGKEMLHYFDRSAHYDGWVILFTEAFFSSTPEDIRFLRSSPVFNSLPDVSHIRIQPGDNPFSTLLSLMKEEQQRNPADKRQQRILKNLLYNFLLLAERKIKDGHPAFVRQSPEFDNILLFKDLLETNFLKEKSVNFYIKNLNITEKKLNSATSHVIGRTPKELIDERVLLEAKMALLYTRKSIKEICFDLGFDEPTNFIKFFRRHTGKTPMECRLAFFTKA